VLRRARRGARGFDAARRVDSRAVGKAVIHDDEVRRVLIDRGDRVRDGRGDRDHPDVTARLEQANKIVGEQIVVLDDHHRDPSL